MNLKNILQNKENIAIFGHTNIDGDCLGSMLSLGGILESLGKTVTYVADQPVSARNRVPDIKKITPDLDTSILYDLWVGVDFSPRHRTGGIYRDNQAYFDQLKDNILIIDHHVEDNFHATRNLKDAKADSNCVRLYELIKENEREHLITPKIATHLLMGIITDTGRFMFDSQPTRILQTSAKLIELGADKKFLIHHLYRNTNPDIIPVMQQVLSNYRIQDDIIITYRDESAHGKIAKSEREIILSFIQGLAGYKVCIFATIANENSIKLSLRSKQAHEVEGPIVDVNKLSQAHFSGGGHIHAAGGIFRHNSKTPEAMETIFSLTKEFINQ